MKKIKLLMLLSIVFFGNSTLMAQWQTSGNSAPANNRLGTNNLQPVNFYAGNRQHGILSTAGLWGIGTNTPQSKLHFTGDLTTDWGLNFYHYQPGFAAAHQKKVWLKRHWNGIIGDYLMLCSSGNRSNTAQSSMVLAEGGVFLGRGKDDGTGLSSEWMRIDRSGNVGIGTQNPATRLEVNRNNGSYLIAKFTNSATTGDRTALIDIQNGQNVLWRYGVGGLGNGLGINNGQFYIERAGLGSAFTITTNGNVGIGTNAPDPYYKLSVRGPIRATEVRVNTGWADYVFAKDYQLKSLAEVEQYINQNKHLPDVPSAAEVEKNGINVGEMNALLLRKIEELTLHMISLKKENDRLSNRLEQIATPSVQK